MLLNSLSKKLRDELYIDAYYKQLNNIQLFSQNFSVEFIKKLASIVQEVTYASDEIIAQKGSDDNKIGIHYILSGEVDFYLDT